MGHVEVLSRTALELRLEDVPDDVVRDAKRLIIDTFGCIIGSQKTEIGPIVLNSIGGFGGSGRASIVGRHRRTSPFGAAYANGRLGNAMDFDDTHASGIHLATGVITGALAFAEKKGQTGAEFLLSVIAGYEVGGRFCRAFGPFFSQQEMGPIHSFGDDGSDRSFPRVWSLAAPLALGAAAAAGHCLQLTLSTFTQALATSVYNAPLLQGSAWTESLVDLPNMKYCDAGMCSLVGVQSALMAQTGTTSFPALLEGDAAAIGLFGDRSMTGLDYLSEGLGSDWMIRNATLKPWPSCRLTHQPMTALHRLLADAEIEPEDIDRIVVQTNRVGCVDRFTQSEPRSYVARQFSIPHMIAMQVLRVPPGPLWMSGHWSGEQRYRDLVDRIEICTHPDGERFDRFMTDNEFREIPGGVTVVCGGVEHHAESEFAIGDPWSGATRMSDRDLDRKFETQVEADDMSSLLDDLRNLQNCPSVEGLMNLIADTAGLDQTLQTGS